MDSKVVIQIRIAKELKKWLDRKSKQWGTDTSHVVREILETVQDWEEMGNSEKRGLRSRFDR